MGNLILATSAKSTSSAGSYSFLLIIVGVLVLMYFVMVRPQRNRQRRVMEQQRSVQPGQRVRTTAGLYATISAIDGDDVLLEVSPGVEMRFMRRAIMEVLPDDDDTDGSEMADPEESGEYATDEEADAGDEAGETGEHEDAAVADTASETETTDEAEAAPNANGMSPADEGRPASRLSASASASGSQDN